MKISLDSRYTAILEETMARRKSGTGNGATSSSLPGEPGVGHNQELSPMQKRQLFLDHKAKVQALVDKKNKAVSDIRNQFKKVKADGFTKHQIEDAIRMDTPEGEAELKSQIAETMQAALWVGSSIGAQLEMFNSPDRQPADDRAFDEGLQASMTGKTAKPPYDPNTSQHRSFMRGYHEHQTELAKGFGAGAEVTSGEKVTRSEAKARLKAGGDAGTKLAKE